MLGGNPERSFLGKFGLGSMPNSNFLRWWLKPSRNSLMVQRYKNTLSYLSFYRFFSVTYPSFINFTSFLCSLTRSQTVKTQMRTFFIIEADGCLDCNQDLYVFYFFATNMVSTPLLLCVEELNIII